MKHIADHIKPTVLSDGFVPGTLTLQLVTCSHSPPCKTGRLHKLLTKHISNIDIEEKPWFIDLACWIQWTSEREIKTTTKA